MMETGQGRTFIPRGLLPQANVAELEAKPGDRTQEAQEAGSAAGVLARIRAMLGGASPEASQAGAGAASPTHDKSAEDRRTEREAPASLKAELASQTAQSAKLRKENDDLRRQLAELQGTVRALKEELAGGGGWRKSEFPKPYRNLADQDHERILAFIEKHGMDPAEDYDRTLTGLAATGEIKIRRT